MFLLLELAFIYMKIQILFTIILELGSFVQSKTLEIIEVFLEKKLVPNHMGISH